MTRVDFYVLAPATEPALARERFAARLAHRARRDQRRIYLCVPDAIAASRLDLLLWDYPDGAFLPHGIAGTAAAEGAPVVIGDGPPPPDQHDLLINLGADIPEFFSSFARVAEVVGNEAAARAVGRERFRYYRDRGYPLEHHDVS